MTLLDFAGLIGTISVTLGVAGIWLAHEGEKQRERDKSAAQPAE